MSPLDNCILPSEYVNSILSISSQLSLLTIKGTSPIHVVPSLYKSKALQVQEIIVEAQ